MIKTVVAPIKVKKYKDKKFSLQFLPAKLVQLSKEKHFIFQEKKLKSAYIIDIVHNLLLRYYFRKENRFNISATILKEKYGYQYNFYIDYLVENNIFQLIQNYKKGRNARIYGINPSILRSSIYRYKNEDKFLLKKYKNKLAEYEMDDKNIIPLDVREKLIDDLYSVQIEFERSIFYLDTLKREDIDIYNRNKYSVESINENHIFYHFDTFGRMHTNFTILKGFIRKNCLLIDGEETDEIDIHNSQPLFLTKLIKDSKTSWVIKEEYDLFKTLTLSGNYYQFLMDNLHTKDRKEVKEITYKVLFGRNQKNSAADMKFKKLFPTIHNFIKLYKEEHNDYKILAYHLQKAESNLIFRTIVRRIMNLYPEVKILTVHDSIIVPRSHKKNIEDIFNAAILEEFNEV